MPNVFIKWLPNNKMQKAEKDKYRVWALRSEVGKSQMIIAPLGSNRGLLISNTQVLRKIVGV